MAESPLDLHDPGIDRSFFQQAGAMARGVDGTRAGGFVEGGLHPAEAPGAGQVTAWRCPACGNDQIGVFELGCPGCGAGKPGHKVVEGQRRPQPPVAAAEAPPRPAIARTPPTIAPSPSRAAFEGWIAQRPDWEVYDLMLWDVWDAAWRAASATPIPVSGAQAMHLPLPDPLREVPPGDRDVDAVARTIAAALDHFVDTVLIHMTPEEIAADGWLGVEAARRLADQLRPIGPVDATPPGDPAIPV